MVTHVDVTPPTWAWVVLLVIVASGVGGALYIAYERLKIRRAEAEEYLRLERKEAYALESAVDRLRDQMSLPSLINLNRIVLDKYHGIATEQAESSFTSSRRAMAGGFAWLLACFAAVLFVPGATDAQLFIGSLAVAGGALSAFLGRTYIHVYERSLVQLNRYFEQPLLNSYLLSAERIIGEMQSGKDEAYLSVLHKLLQAGGTSGQAMAERSTPFTDGGLTEPSQGVSSDRMASSRASSPGAAGRDSSG